jgi:hypothetical protein
MLSELLIPPVVTPEKKQDADKLIELFLRLQNQALLNFEQPSKSSPQGIRELCRMH